VPLLRGGDDPDKLLAAVRMLDALPRPESADAMASLLDLAGQQYDRATFWNVLGKDRVMQSWLWQLGRDEGEARGRAEGEARALRLVCADLAKELHPRVAARVLPPSMRATSPRRFDPGSCSAPGSPVPRSPRS
jgi:hypothetical protein